MLNDKRRLALLLAAGVSALGAAAVFTDPSSERTASAVASAETVVLQPGSFEHPLPGEFLKGGHPVAAPRVSVEFGRPLEIMKYQVGAGDYRRCVEAGACRPTDQPGREGVPATGVSHIDAEAYAAWYSRVTGEEWRLPTDAEWAHAAAEKFAGDIESQESDPANPALRWLARYRTESALGRKADPQSRPQGAFGVNSKGVADIAGNVWEWTSTCYVHATVAASGKLASGSLENCGVHVVEGFHRTYMSNFIRDGKSGGCAVGTPPDNLGFRLVRERPGFAGRLSRLFRFS
jgi:formylglycine-generating enzyme required for sulfatase activity